MHDVRPVFAQLPGAARLVGYKHAASLFNALKRGDVPDDCIVFFGGRRFFHVANLERWLGAREARRAQRRRS